MLTESAYLLKITSTFSVLLPIVVLLLGRYYRTWPYRLFLIFLVFGFIVDFSGWIFFLIDDFSANWIFRYSYSLFEPVFLLGWIAFFFKSNIVKKTIYVFVCLSFLFWILSVFFQPAFSAYYIFTEVTIAFFAGFLVLEIIENKETTEMPLNFWIVFGIFFYNLCTFFIKGLIEKEISEKLWFVENLVNIATNVIFAVGFGLNLKNPNKDK